MPASQNARFGIGSTGRLTRYAVRVGSKILVRRSEFDRWLETHQVKHIDVGCIVDELVAGVKELG
jgi:hypothetical protein